MKTIKERIQSEAVAVLQKYGVVKACLFGSTARGTESISSDIDIVVELEEGRSLFDLVGLGLELEELLKRKVDVLTYDSVHPRLVDEIVKEQEVVYEKKPPTYSLTICSNVFI